MHIKNIRKIPRFVGEYFNLGIITEQDLKDLSKIITTDDYCILNEEKLIKIVDINSEIINFCLNKSKINRYYRCKYEDEIDIPKCLASDIMVVELDNGSCISVTIDDFDNEYNCLILKIEDYNIPYI